MNKISERRENRKWDGRRNGKGKKKRKWEREEEEQKRK